MNRLLIFMAALSCAGVSVANAEQYWIAYEGDDFPENEGWTRVTGDGGAQRWIEEGALVLDSLESVWIVDFYQVYRPIDPEAGELFRMRWRLKVDEVYSFVDPGVGVFSDDFRAVGFEFSESSLQSVFEPGATASFAPYVFHNFELRSWDMLEYELLIDGEVAVTGEFMAVFEAGRVGWGDVIQGGRSLSRWDYFRFGVVPEPTTLLGSIVGMLLILVQHKIRRSQR